MNNMNMEKQRDQEKYNEKEKQLTREWNDVKETQKGNFHIQITCGFLTQQTLFLKDYWLYEVVF